MKTDIREFVRESNKIEGILREPTEDEIEAHGDILAVPEMEITDLEDFVAIVAPGNRLRNLPGLNVRVGNHIAPEGGPQIPTKLGHLLKKVNERNISPWEAHCQYESLHPFTDGNGRSGRALWLWMMMEDAPLRFLHHFYYQTLSHHDSCK